MRGLDTNVIVRFLVKDDVEQAIKAVAFIRNACTTDSPCFVNRIVLCELAWVLEAAYRYRREVIADVIGKILRTGEFRIEDGDEAWAALLAYRESGTDFADCLLGKTNLARGCDATATFDVQAGRLDGFQPLA